jgi:hypothetical protein
VPLRTRDDLPEPVRRECDIVVEKADQLRKSCSRAEVARGVEATSGAPDQSNSARDLHGRLGSVVHDDDLETLSPDILSRDPRQQLGEKPVPVSRRDHDGSS